MKDVALEKCGLPHPRFGDPFWAVQPKANRQSQLGRRPKAVAAVWESARSWDGQTKIEESVAPAPQLAAPERLTMQRALEAFTGEFEEYAAPNTQKKYRLILQKLKRFSESKGYVLLEQWGRPMFESSAHRGQ